MTPVLLKSKKKKENEYRIKVPKATNSVVPLWSGS